MSSYAGSDQYPTTLTLPDTNQPATADATNNMVKDLADRGVFNFRRAGMVSDPCGPVRLSSIDGTTVQAAALGGVIVTDSSSAPRFISMAAQNITVAQLDTGAPAFDGSKNYAIYLYFDVVSGLPKYQISAVMPEPTGFFMFGTVSHRFVGGFCTDAGAKIRRFYQNRNEVIYETPISLVLAGNQTVATAIDMAVKALPPYAALVSLQTETITTIAASGFSVLGPKGADFAGGAGIRTATSSGANDRQAKTLHLHTSSDRKLEYYVNAATTTVSIDMLGYSF